MNYPQTHADIEIHKLVRSRRKTIALIIQRDGALTIRAPLKASNRSILEFVEKSAVWIHKKQAEVRAAVPPPAKQYLPGETFLFLGKEYPLEIAAGQKPALILDGHFKLAASARANAEQVFEQWYRERARGIVTERVRWFADRYNFQYQKIRISSAHTRWGSCSPKGALSFSWRLILTPPEVVDYVIVHELAHTLVHNHSKRFWKQVENILPEYKVYNRWLRQNGQ